MSALERDEGIAQLVAGTKAVFAGKPPSRDGLVAILGLLETVAAKRHLWSNADYPVPAGKQDALYLIGEEPDRQVNRGPDLWVLEIEDKQGRNPFEGKVV